MAATERRTGVSRRGMTVLGKVPIAPKPINLPSQRSTFCWGSAGRLLNGGGLSGKFETALLDPVISGDKLQSKLVTPTGIKNHGDGVDFQEKKVQSSSMTARANLFSSGAATTTTTRASKNVGKMEEPRKSSSYTCNFFESGKQEMTDPSRQKDGDGCARGVPVPPGFSHNGPPVHNSRSGLSSADTQCNGIGNVMHSETSQQNGSQSIPGMPYRNGAKDREIIVIHMVGGPGFYGNYPPQFGFPESYNRTGGVFGNFPLQFGNFEPIFGLQGHGGAHVSAATGSNFFDEHEDFVCYEKECYKGACHDFGRHRNSWMRGTYRENSFLGGVQGEGYDALIPSPTSTIRSRPPSQRHLSRNAGRSRSLYRNGRVVSMEETTAEPVSEKRITLLTKVSQHDAQAKNPLKEIGGDNKDAQIPVGPVCSPYLNEEFCEDEGKAPLEIFEARKVTDDAQVETSLPADVSVNLEVIDEETLQKDCKVESNKFSSSKTTCNEKCLHCKGAAVMGGSATMYCQACEKTTVCESNFSISQRCLEPTEEVPVTIVEKDSFVDGCKADVKHVILDADNYSISTIKSEAVSKEQETAMESNNGSLVPQSGNSEVLETGTSLSSDTCLTKTAERQKKLVFKKKSQFKSMTKPGIRVSKALVMTKRPGFQGTNLTSAVGSSLDSKESVEVAKTQQEDHVQKSGSSPTSQLIQSKALNLKGDTSVSFVAPVKKNAERQQKLVYRKRVAEQVAIGPQPSRNSSKTSQSTKSLSASPQAELGLEDEKDRVRLTPSASVSKYHIILVEDSEGDYYLPTAPLSSNDGSKQQLEKVKEKIVPATAASFRSSDSELLPLQESRSGIKSCNSCSKDTLHTAAGSLQPSRSPLWSSRHEDNATKTHGKSGRPLSAWKPKVARQAAGSGNSFIEKEKESNSPASAQVETPDEKTGSLCSGPVGALNTLNEGNIDEKHLVRTLDELSLESKSSGCGTPQCGENNQLTINQPDELLIQEKLAEKLLESAVFIGQTKSGSPKHAGELPPPGLSAPMYINFEDILAPKEVMVGNSKPFVKKVMSFEKANLYHQTLIRRYKEIGQWKPKANLHKKSMRSKENVCANQDSTKASRRSLGN